MTVPLAFSLGRKKHTGQALQGDILVSLTHVAQATQVAHALCVCGCVCVCVSATEIWQGLQGASA